MSVFAFVAVEGVEIQLSDTTLERLFRGGFRNNGRSDRLLWAAFRYSTGGSRSCELARHITYW